MDRIFQLIAVVLAGFAAYFLWFGQNDAGFVSAVLGAVAFFLNIRSQVKKRNRLREENAGHHDENGDG